MKGPLIRLCVYSGANPGQSFATGAKMQDMPKKNKKVRKKNNRLKKFNIRNIVHIILGEMLQKSSQTDHPRPRRRVLQKKMW